MAKHNAKARKDESHKFFEIFMNEIAEPAARRTRNVAVSLTDLWAPPNDILNRSP